MEFIYKLSSDPSLHLTLAVNINGFYNCHAKSNVKLNLNAENLMMILMNLSERMVTISASGNMAASRLIRYT